MRRSRTGYRMADRGDGLEEVSELPAPPRPPSIAAQRVQQWGPLLAGIAAIITSLATLIAAFGGAFKPDLSELNASVKELTTAAQRIQQWADRHEGKHEVDERLELNRQRQVDDAIGRHDRQIEALRER